MTEFGLFSHVWKNVSAAKESTGSGLRYPSQNPDPDPTTKLTISHHTYIGVLGYAGKVHIIYLQVSQHTSGILTTLNNETHMREGTDRDSRLCSLIHGVYYVYTAHKNSTTLPRATRALQVDNGGGGGGQSHIAVERLD